MKDKKSLEQMKTEAQNAESRGDYFEASILYKRLLGEASKQNSSEMISEAKRKMLEMNDLSRDEFKEISVEQEIPTEEIEKAVKQIIGDSNDLEEILIRLCLHSSLIPKKGDIETSSRNNTPVFSFLASNHIISKDNHSLGGNDQGYIWYMENYRIHQDLIARIYLHNIFYKLREEKGLTFEKLKTYFGKSKAFLADDLFFIEAGLKNFFEGDYVAAIHVLVPRFEKCFIEISKACGINTVSLKRVKKNSDDIITSDITLSTELLRKKEFTDVWGEDFCENIVFVFYETLGYGLRHKVAHGKILSTESNQLACELIIYFYLVLGSRAIGKSINSESNL